MRRWEGILCLVLLAVALGAMASPAEAQFGKLKDKLKQKVDRKVDQKVDRKIDDTLSGTKKDANEDTDKGEEKAAESKDDAAPQAAGPKGGTAAAEDMAVFTKYDFVPGDKVIFFDDLSRDEIGEFPSRWKLENGVFEIAKQGDRNFILCTDKGALGPKISPGPLPPKYTIEVEFWSKGSAGKGHWFHIHWFDGKGGDIGNFGMEDNTKTNLRILNKDLAQKELAAPLSAGLHTMRVMATKSSMKCYIDNERVANVPATDGFLPESFNIYMDPWKDEQNNPMLLGTLRYAEGGETLKEQLDEAGRIVTHGILFDSGSAKIRGESYKTLADIGGLLTGSPDLRLSIEGHTDSDGGDAANAALSEGRAASVKSYLIDTYKIDGARMEAKGWGESKPIDTNDTAEGKANNRRVELVKL